MGHHVRGHRSSAQIRELGSLLGDNVQPPGLNGSQESNVIRRHQRLPGTGQRRTKPRSWGDWLAAPEVRSVANALICAGFPEYTKAMGVCSDIGVGRPENPAAIDGHQP